MVMGHGTPPTARALAHGLRPSLSIDVVTTVPGDMFTQMRFLFAHDRLLAHEAAFAAGSETEPTLLTSREVLEFATIEGARVCGLEERTGSLTPGKQADVILVRCDDTNTYPVIDRCRPWCSKQTRGTSTPCSSRARSSSATAVSSTPTCAARATEPPSHSTTCSATRPFSRAWCRAPTRVRMPNEEASVQSS
jgi:hypothetical protein